MCSFTGCQGQQEGSCVGHHAGKEGCKRQQVRGGVECWVCWKGGAGNQEEEVGGGKGAKLLPLLGGP